ncbi:MAG: hypothetical protein V4760_07825, partial [Bdellovibrionota bacterium]
HFGPAVHTVGWSPSPLWGDMTTNNTVNESGFFKFEDKGGGKFEYSLVNWPGKGPWLKLFHDPLIRTLKAAEKAQASVLPALEISKPLDKKSSGSIVIKRFFQPMSCKAIFAGG